MQKLAETTTNVAYKILITSQKGGVGKSTLSANLAAYLQCAGSKVTLIDFDTHGSSSAWLENSPCVGVNVQHRVLPLNQGSNRPFMDARLYLCRAANISEVVICDLTWTDSISSDLMFEYDLVIVPTSVSDIELAATSEFLKRHSWIFDSKIRMSPTLLLTPTRVQYWQLNDDVFSKRHFPVSFMLAPPVLESQSAREMFQFGYLKDLKDACGASFNEFCKAVIAIRNKQHLSHESNSQEELDVGVQSFTNLQAMQQHKWRSSLLTTRGKLSNQYSLLERHRIEKMKVEELPASESLPNLPVPYLANSLFSLKLPNFLKSR